MPLPTLKPVFDGGSAAVYSTRRKMVKIIACRRNAGDELSEKVCGASSQVKVVTGVVNNVAVAVMLHALGEVRKHPNYRHEVKRLYMQAVKEMHSYEDRLLHAKRNRFFHVDDMPGATRKTYDGRLTDRQYFELWQGMGGEAYNRVFPLVTCLHNKFKLSLERHGVGHAYIMAWPMTAMACLTIAVKAYTVMLEQIHRDWGISEGILAEVFRDFSMRRVYEAWHRAVYATDRLEHDLDDGERKNIEMSVLQLAETLADSDLILESVAKVLPEYAEMFRTQGEMKKAQRQIIEFKRESDEYKKNART